METAYDDFIKSKECRVESVGLTVLPELNGSLFPYQRDIVGWALRRGRAAIFDDCGMGKTLMQLEWARCVVEESGGNVLILTPLAVAHQTAAEASRFGITASVSRDGIIHDGITITNYQQLHKLDISKFSGVVLDESSIIKAFDGKMRTMIVDSFARTPYRLACTATPAPNDHVELGNHAEFLGVMSRVEMLASYFCHDGGETSVWRLKGHAEGGFWRWVASWAVCIRRPSDLGYKDIGFDMPKLEFHEHIIASTVKADSALFFDALTLSDQRLARRESLDDRVSRVAAMVNQSSEPWLIWCELNAEGDALAKAITDAVQVAGADTDEQKTARMAAFSSGEARVMVTKPAVAGFGMNWQHCANMAFVGLSHSYEQFYQATRRCWRYGQKRDVHVHVVTTDAEMAILRNIKRKQRESDTMATQMIGSMADVMNQEIRGIERNRDGYKTEKKTGKDWTMHLGDCVDVVRALPRDSVHFTVFSPPFASLYTYSNSPRDMGNCRTHSEFFGQFKFLVAELHRVTMPGRLLSFHCMNLPTSKERDGHTGITDFRGELIRTFVEAGWIFHSEVCIWKDPVTAMQRTKALGLLHKTIRKDSSMSRQGIPDYLVTMRKPGENPERISHTHEEFPVELWQRYASPVWAVEDGKDEEGFSIMKQDINPSDTLQKESAREEKDERHICPLQLEVIRRALKLWSNPGDLVLSPFGGIGSEGFVALKEGRKFIGAELKASYYKQACANLAAAELGDAQFKLI